MRRGIVVLLRPGLRQDGATLIEKFLDTSRLFRSPSPVQVDRSIHQFLDMRAAELAPIGMRIHHRLDVGMPLGKRPARPF
jgi:hypothetical protein